MLKASWTLPGEATAKVIPERVPPRAPKEPSPTGLVSLTGWDGSLLAPRATAAR